MAVGIGWNTILYQLKSHSELFVKFMVVGFRVYISNLGEVSVWGAEYYYNCA